MSSPLLNADNYEWKRDSDMVYCWAVKRIRHPCLMGKGRAINDKGEEVRLNVRQKDFAGNH